MQKLATLRATAIAGVVGSVFWVSAASALPVYIGYDAGGGVPPQSPIIAGEFNLDGLAIFTGVVSGPSGTFSVNDQALGVPNLSAGDLLFGQSIIVRTDTGGTLKVYVSELNVPGSGIAGFLSTFNTNPLSTYTSLTEQTFIGAANTLWDTTTAISPPQLLNPGDTASFLATLDPGASYSITQVFTIVLGPGQSSTASIDVALAQTPLRRLCPCLAACWAVGCSSAGCVAVRPKSAAATLPLSN